MISGDAFIFIIKSHFGIEEVEKKSLFNREVSVIRYNNIINLP